MTTIKKWLKKKRQELGWTLGRLFSAEKRKARKLFLKTYQNRRLLSRRLSGTKLGGQRINEILADTAPHYRRYYIPKADGGKREICEPSPELKRIQKAALPVIKIPPVSKNTAAYEKGMSVKKNAECHKNAKHILHIDIKDFFPSVNKEIFLKIYSPLICNKCSGENCVRCTERLWRIVSLGGGLPIGACTSPFIANRVMADTDERLSQLDKSMVYTRYADDMVFSAQKPIDQAFVGQIEDVIHAAGFQINHQKTYFMKSRKQVTGVLVNNGKLSVGTSYKKRLKKDLYNYLVKDIGKADAIRGRFAYLAEIEPGYAKTLQKKYRSLDKKHFFGKAG